MLLIILCPPLPLPHTPYTKQKGGERGGREREMHVEAILFVGGVREREKKIKEEGGRRNVICGTYRCHTHLPPLTR